MTLDFRIFNAVDPLRFAVSRFLIAILKHHFEQYLLASHFKAYKHVSLVQH